MGKLYRINFTEKGKGVFEETLQGDMDKAKADFKAKYPQAPKDVVERVADVVIDKHQAEKQILKSLCEFSAKYAKDFGELNEISETIRKLKKSENHLIITGADRERLNTAVGLEFPEKDRFVYLRELSEQLQNPTEVDDVTA